MYIIFSIYNTKVQDFQEMKANDNAFFQKMGPFFHLMLGLPTKNLMKWPTPQMFSE